MDKTSSSLLLKAKRQQLFKKRFTIAALSFFILQLALMVAGVNHLYENAVLWGLLVVSYLVSSELFGVTKNQLITELEKSL